MPNIIIGFSKPKKDNIVSKLIRAADGVAFSHTYMAIYSNSTSRWLYYHASGTQVHFLGEEMFHHKNDVVDSFIVTISDADRIKIMQHAIDTIGMPYGIKQLIGMGIVRACGFLGVSVRNPFRDGRQTYVCSELMGEVLKMLNIIDVDVNLDDIRPIDIYTALSNIAP